MRNLTSCSTAKPGIFFIREKPSFIHPVTGNYIVQYTEDNGGPSPCSYVLPRKSSREKNAPAYTFGTRCLVEKSKFFDHLMNDGENDVW